jgi:phosphopantetheinyl transferase (holo-ACP synthase)
MDLAAKEAAIKSLYTSARNFEHKVITDVPLLTNFSIDTPEFTLHSADKVVQALGAEKITFEGHLEKDEVGVLLTVHW